MNLRDYQQRACDSIEEKHQESRSTLVVLPTGMGKTVVFSEAIRRRRKYGRAMVMAHRQELIFQAARTLKRVCNEEPAIEMGSYESLEGSLIARPGIVVASKDSLHKSRIQRFRESEFATVVIDEAHHATADSYVNPIAHFASAKIIGVTATPDRADEEALGQVFETVAFEYGIDDGIRDGWLVPIKQTFVTVDEIEYAGLGKTLGDFNQGQLADMLEREKVLWGMVVPTVEKALNLPRGTVMRMIDDTPEDEFHNIPERLAKIVDVRKARRTLIFTTRVHQAEKVCEIINRLIPDSAIHVDGTTPEEERAAIFRDYGAGRYQFLANVGVATEGWDDPATDGRGVQIVAIMRPTMSRPLYAQMIGRGTRPLPGVVDGPETAEERKEAIAASNKPHVLVIDFVGSGNFLGLRHVADVLGGKLTDEDADRAAEEIEREGRGQDGDINEDEVDVLESITETVRAIEDEKREEARRRIVAGARYNEREVDPFAVLGRKMKRVPGWFAKRPPSEKQIECLKRRGLYNPAIVTNMGVASQLIDMPTPKMVKCMVKAGVSMEEIGRMDFGQARNMMDALAANNWRLPAIRA